MLRLTSLAADIIEAILRGNDDAGKPFVNVGPVEIAIGGAQPDDPTAGAKKAVLTVKAQPV